MDSEITDDSGEIIYIENRRDLFLEVSDQTEDIKIIVEF